MTNLPIAWYSSTEFQNRYKRWMYGDEKTKTVCLQNRINPFQVILPTGGSAITLLEAYPVNGGSPTDVLALIPSGDHDYITYTDYSIAVYYGQANLTSNLDMGQYFLKISDGVTTKYSEVITVIDSVDEYIEIRWRNTYDIQTAEGHIMYSDDTYYNRYWCRSGI